MRFSSLVATAAAVLAPLASAQGVLQTSSLNACPGSTNSGFTATLFDVIYTSNNNTISFNINAISSISQKVKAQIEVIAYGLVIINETFDPCTDASLSSLCPLNPGPINLNSNKQFGSGGPTSSVPQIAYTWPDLDGTVRAYITDHTNPSIQLACVEAELSNGKTVNQLGVKWTTAVISGLALVISAVVSGLGHSNTAAHIASNALALFGFFQSQALIGMTAVAMPPMAESWTQNFQWTMGIIGVDFMQDVCTWYQRATGGTPSTILGNLQNVSVEVQKRSLEGLTAAARLARRGLAPLANRHLTTIARRGVQVARRGISMLSMRDTTAASTATQQTVVAGIERVGFRSNIEPTNIFLTGLGIFVAFIVLVSVFVAAFKGVCELAAKRGMMKQDKFADFRNGWKIVLKGILFRIVLIGYAQMSVLCLWELTVRDSVAEVIVAIFYFLAMTGVLFWAALKVVRIAKRSVSLHKNPAYILYSDPTALNKWGFLYVQYRATAYYFIIPQLIYILCKSVFVALAQGSPIAQAIGFIIIEASWLIAVSIVRPWMDKKTNGLNIAIAAMSFLSAVFLLIFTQVFNQPGIVTGVVGVLFFFLNAIFASVLLIMLIVSSVFAIIYKNPDARYQPMRDDRGSFIKSQTNLNTELDALGATARGDMAMKRDLDDDSDSFTSHSMARQQHDAQGVPLPHSSAASAHADPYQQQPPYGEQAQPFMGNNAPAPYAGGGYARNASPAPRYGGGGYGNGGGYSAGGYSDYNRAGSMQSQGSYRPYNNGGGGAAAGSPWQRGAGYDH